MSLTKNKIINDPIYGFISIRFPLIWQLIEHPFIQRLRRVSQLGLSSLVFPGANHSRFHHAIGAMHLMDKAIITLKSKGHEITKKEHEASLIAILLHDVGHGPFSHALENSIVNNLNHEKISLMYMYKLNDIFDKKLSTAIEIFTKKYRKKFLNQLVSSQIDVDRMDYLNRDSFYSGVNEGIISSDRIISMLNVFNNELVVDYKGLYSVEKFVIARKLMYWQVYLHKTVLSAEHTLMQILKRAKKLFRINYGLFCTPDFKFFLDKKEVIDEKFFNERDALTHFSKIDDTDIISCLKCWANSDDKVLKILANCIINRNLLKIKTVEKNIKKDELLVIRKLIKEQYKLSNDEVDYLVFPIEIENLTYNTLEQEIKFLKSDNKIIKFSDVKDEINMDMRNSKISKYYICHPEFKK